jgi:hypothetical protein
LELKSRWRVNLHHWRRRTLPAPEFPRTATAEAFADAAAAVAGVATDAAMAGAMDEEKRGEMDAAKAAIAVPNHVLPDPPSRT